MSPILKASTFSLTLYSISLLLSPCLTTPPPSKLQGRDGPTTLSFSLPAYTPPPIYTGDAINVTKCFCQSTVPAEQSPNERQSVGFGNWYKVDYYNWHAKGLYTISWACTSPSLDKDVVPNCWDEDHGEKEGQRFNDGNTFAYKAGKDGIWGDGQGDHFYFNDQKRALPEKADFRDPAPNVCVGACKGLGDGMEVAKDLDSTNGDFVKTWSGKKGQTKTIQSAFLTYNKVDDMCDDCK
ncbi:hypothetical protein ACLMJK_004050 [Lecanora helva]